MSAQTIGKKMLYLRPSQLVQHPNNMRRFYTKSQVEEMAASILASGGVLEPLIVVKEPKGSKYLVVNGNMRLAGATHLAERSPVLECKEVSQSEAEQALTMATANGVRYDIDPVSEGLHYKSLKDTGLSVRDISKRTGIYEARIHNRLYLAELEPGIQKMIVDGKLPSSAEASKALLRLAPAQRLRVATRLAENPHTKVVTIIKACDQLANGPTKGKRLQSPAAELSGAKDMPEGNVPGIRAAASKMCRRCNQYEALEGRALEPA